MLLLRNGGDGHVRAQPLSDTDLGPRNQGLGSAHSEEGRKERRKDRNLNKRHKNPVTSQWLGERNGKE